MAYEKQEWVNGDIITAEKLNHIEDRICIANGDGITLFNGSVTTDKSGGRNIYMDILDLNLSEDNDSITLIVNGSSYQLPKVTLFYGFGYGEFKDGSPVFGDYPYAIGFDSNSNSCGFFAPDINTYEIEIKIGTKSDNNFIIELNYDENEHKYVASKSIQEINNAYIEGKKLILNLWGLYCEFKGRDSSMIGNTYTFTGITEEPMFESSTQVSLKFYTVYISNDQVRFIQKTASLNVQ